jgi:radical SAM superfamily enzyme YgiQ (UPF0313 family)
VLSEIESILSNYPQVNAIEFIDNLFLCDIAVTDKLCRELIKNKINQRIKWKAQTRANGINKDILMLMKEAGCFMLGFGFESGSQRILDRMNKMVRVSECLEAARLTKKAGLELEAYFIYGYPDETKEEFLETLDVIKKMQPDFVGYGRLSPVPGSLEYDRLIKENRPGYKYEDPALDWEKMNIYKRNVTVNYTKMADDEFMQMEKFALYEVIKPINIRHHISAISKKDLLNPRYMLKLLKKSLIVFKNPGYFFKRTSDFMKILFKTRKKK